MKEESNTGLEKKKKKKKPNNNNNTWCRNWEFCDFERSFVSPEYGTLSDMF